MQKQVRSALASLLTPRRNRLLLKIAGWSRIGFLKEIFEDAKFIHIVRDGRAVASSVMHVNFWRGWRGPQGWGAGLLSPEYQAAWDATNRSFIALAGIQWQLRTRAMEAARQKIDPKDFLEVKYEAFCDQPLETYRRVLDFAEFPSQPCSNAISKRQPSRARATVGGMTSRPRSRPSSKNSCGRICCGTATT